MQLLKNQIQWRRDDQWFLEVEDAVRGLTVKEYEVFHDYKAHSVNVYICHTLNFVLIIGEFCYM